MINLSNFVVN